MVDTEAKGGAAWIDYVEEGAIELPVSDSLVDSDWDSFCGSLSVPFSEAGETT